MHWQFTVYNLYKWNMCYTIIRAMICEDQPISKHHKDIEEILFTVMKPTSYRIADRVDVINIYSIQFLQIRHNTY